MCEIPVTRWLRLQDITREPKKVHIFIVCSRMYCSLKNKYLNLSLFILPAVSVFISLNFPGFEMLLNFAYFMSIHCDIRDNSLKDAYLKWQQMAWL